MMASNAARTVRAIKPHVPLIRFPARKGADGKSVDAVLTGGNPAASAASSTTSSTPSSPPSKPIGSTPRGSGIDAMDLPNRYHRKPMSAEEMEYIERGGPL